MLKYNAESLTMYVGVKCGKKKLHEGAQNGQDRPINLTHLKWEESDCGGREETAEHGDRFPSQRGAKTVSRGQRRGEGVQTKNKARRLPPNMSGGLKKGQKR